MLLQTVLAAAGDPLSHVLDKPNKIGPLSMNTITLIVVTVLLVWALMKAAKAIQTDPSRPGNDRYITRGTWGSIVEVIVLHLRDQVIRPQLGEQTNKFLPFLLTLFFFILFNNMFGLLPLIDIQYLVTSLLAGDSHAATAYIGGTATGRIAVTAALALIAFLMWNYNGIKALGLGGFLKHFLGGGPVFLAPVMIPVEIMGTLVKPTALALRLFANMTAGHILLGVLVIFTAAAPKAIGLLGAPVSLVALVGAVAIFFLEIFVALLQAFIFTFLTTLFISQLSHHHGGHDDHDHDHAHDHAGHHAHPAPAHAH
ncbi:MAG: F0F1 ATP synthase subunit A [Planctomycetota bacterium]|nr:F0F1 ATP synthase subunit A [Planctomycetota bacterium]